MTYLEGVYWDLDGTIANTELEAHLPAFNKAFIDLGLNWYWDQSTYIDLLKINGGRRRISHYGNLLNLQFDEEFIIKIHKQKQENYLNLIENGSVSLKTGVNRLISELSNNNVRQFIVTSSSKVQVKVLVKKLFDNNPFEFCITSEDVELHKPDPAPYFQAIKLSGINSKNSIVFEDSIAGTLSSYSAKLPTICIKSNIPFEFDKHINLKCLVDTLGDENESTNIIKGPKLFTRFIDYQFLRNYLKEL